MNSATLNPTFTPERLERFQSIVRKYEQPSCALLPVLYLAQEQFGYLSPEVMDYTAKLLSLPANQVYEVVSFYTMFKKKDMGTFCLQVCNNISCTMLGSEELIRVVKEELGLDLFEVAKDGQFSLMPVQCLGSCDTAPVVQINDDYHENLTPENFRQLLRRLKSGEKIGPTSGPRGGH